MRVVAGSAKGKKLLSVPGSGTRPVTDRVKTALFDTIRPQIQDASILDLFAGSGSIGIEALSRGAAQCVFCDLAKEAVSTIKANLTATELGDRSLVFHTDAFKFLRNCKKSFDLIYVAPPQFKNLWVEALYTVAERPKLVSEHGRIIAQIHPKEYEKLQLNAFREEQQRKYGSTLLVFYCFAK